jgi:hypothetical protein
LLDKINVDDKVFIIHLKEIKKTIEKEFIRSFSKKLSSLPEQFIFPTLDFQDFKKSIKNRKYFNEKEEYLIHKARCRHNSSLLRVSKSLGLNNIITGHSPRHSMANHYLFSKSFTLLLLTLLLFSLKRLLLFKVLPYILRLNFIYHYVFRIPLILNQSFFIFSFFYDASFYFCFKLHFD